LPVSQASEIHGKGTFNQQGSKLRKSGAVTDFRLKKARIMPLVIFVDHLAFRQVILVKTMTFLLRLEPSLAG